MAKSSAKLPVKVEEYTALQAQGTFTKAEAVAFKSLSDYINQHIKDNVWWYWELGLKVAKIYRDAQANQQLYGSSMLKRLAIGLGYKTDRQLRNAIMVVDLWKTKKAFTQYLKLRGESGNMLQWTHIVHLAKVGSDDIRMQLAANTLEQCWTSDELWVHVQALSTGKTRGGGRPPKTKVPSTALGCLMHISSQAVKFVENYDKAWTGSAFNIAATVQDIPASKLSEELLEQVKNTRQRLLDMSQRANDYAWVLDETGSDIQQRLTAQAEHDGQVAAETAAADDAAAAGELPDAAGDGDLPLAETLRNKPAREQRAAKKAAATKRANRVGVTRG